MTDMSESFAPTHLVPVQGTRAWAEPDGTVAPVTRLDGGIAVQVVEQRADWARVVRDDGFTGWVDSRQLSEVSSAEPEAATYFPPVAATEPQAAPQPVPLPAQPQPVPAQSVPVADLAPVAATAAAADGIDIRGFSIVTLIGVVAIAVGTFLDWWSVGAASITAWDIPLEFVFTGKASDGFKIGPVLVVLAVVIVLPLLIGRPFPYVVSMGLGTLVLLLAGTTAVRGISQDPSIYPAVGMILTLGGGAMVFGDSAPFWNLRPKPAS